MGYILNTGAMRVVERNDKGNVTYRKRYRRGDEVDVNHLEEGRLETLLAAGTLVESEDDLSEVQDAGSISPVSAPFGAATSDAGAGAPVESDAENEGPDPESSEEETHYDIFPPGQPQATPDPNSTPSGEEEVEEVDEYSDMDYPTLQKTAKARDLNAGGSGDEIRARLREDDASNA